MSEGVSLGILEGDRDGFDEGDELCDGVSDGDEDGWLLMDGAADG